MQKIISFIETAIVTLIFVDAFGFVVWVYSGQHPVDNAYVGSVTAHIIQALFNL